MKVHGKAILVVAALIGTLLGLIFYLLILKRSPLGDELGANGQVASSATKFTLWGAILGGAILGSLLRHLAAAQQQQPRPSLLAAVISAFKSYELWIAVFLSPVIYAALAAQIDKASSDAFYWLAFQQGLVAPSFIKPILSAAKA